MLTPVTAPHAFAPNPRRPRLVVCFTCGRPEWESCHIGSLPGMEDVAQQRREALAIANGERLTAILREPPTSIDRLTGEMEMHSPLFHGSQANPNRPLF